MREPSKRRPKGRSRPVVRVLRARRPVYHVGGAPLPEPSFRKNAVPGSFQFVEGNQHYYGESVGQGRVEQGMVGQLQKNPHLFLFDRKMKRYVLEWTNVPNGVVINTIQRVHTAYRQVPGRVGKFEYLPQKQEELNRAFAKQLGRAPNEFLLSEFLHQNRKSIETMYANGQRVFLRVPIYLEMGPRERVQKYEQLMKIYGSIVSRYFIRKKSDQSTDSVVYFELNMKSKHVRDALGLP